MLASALIDICLSPSSISSRASVLAICERNVLSSSSRYPRSIRRFNLRTRRELCGGQRRRCANRLSKSIFSSFPQPDPNLIQKTPSVYPASSHVRPQAPGIPNFSFPRSKMPNLHSVAPPQLHQGKKRTRKYGDPYHCESIRR